MDFPSRILDASRAIFFNSFSAASLSPFSWRHRASIKRRASRTQESSPSADAARADARAALLSALSICSLEHQRRVQRVVMDVLLPTLSGGLNVGGGLFYRVL